MINEQTGQKNNIAVAGISYVGFSLAVLLSQNNKIRAVDVLSEKVKKINKRISLIQEKRLRDIL